MRLELGREIGVAGHVVAVGEAVAQQDVHDGHGQGAVGAGAQDQAHIGLRHGGGFVDVDDNDLGAPFLAGAHGMGHHIDLGVHRIGAPDDDAVALAHFLRADARKIAGAGDVAGPGGADADGFVLAGIALGSAQAVDAVALHVPHGAGIEIGPDGFGPVLGLDSGKARGNLGHGLVPRDALELTGALRPGALQRVLEAIGVVDALGVAGDFLADDPGRVGVILGATHAANGAIVHEINIEGAGRRAIMRADGADGTERDGLVHGCENSGQRKWRQIGCGD